jgi:hypothetical protein
MATDLNQLLINPEMAGFDRQRRLAEMLLKQGMQTPQGQMIGNIYVGASPYQFLGNLAQQYVGEKELKDIDQKELTMAQALRERKLAETTGIMSALTGTPDQRTELAGPAYQGVAPQAVMPGTPSNPQEALALALKSQTGAGNVLLPSIIEQVLPKQIPDQIKFKLARDGGFTGTFNEFINQMSDADKARNEIEKQRVVLENKRLNLEGARLGIAQQELAFNTGMGMPTAAPTNVGGAFAPKATPQYEYNPALTGKQNQEQAGKFYESLQKNTGNAKDSFDLMKSASEVLSSGAPSSGLLSNTLTTAGEALNLPFGARRQESQADAQLKMLSGALTMKQPRFEGPQGVLDVTLYQKLAGDLGNANIPVASRLATMKQMVDLQKKYYPSGDWGSIKTELNEAGKVSVGAPNKVINFNDLK